MCRKVKKKKSSFVPTSAVKIICTLAFPHGTPPPLLELYGKHATNLSGETRKIETHRVVVGTFSGEGLSPVFQERSSIMDKTNKAREHKKAQEEHRCGQIAHTAPQRGCVASTLVCVKVCENRRA